MADTGTLKTWKAISLALIAAGGLLVAFMVVTEGEPGALPLGLVLVGTAGYAVARVRMRRP
jgi:hypothetical protein